MDKFDLIILGGGPGGYMAAKRASGNGLKVAIIEKRAYGGVCLNEGCIPSKTFLNSAKLYEHAKHSEAFGVISKDVSYDQKAVVARKAKVVNTLVSGIKANLKANKTTMLDGVGEIKSKSSDGFVVSVNGADYLGGKLIIATGSEAIVPPIQGVKEGFEAGLVVTNREILDAEKIPKNLVVVGGGVIGIEMASYFNSVGSNVTVVEMLDQIGGQIDSEIAIMLQKEYEKKGVIFNLNSKLTSVGKGDVTFEKSGKSETIKADMVLLSVGRRANVTGIGLEALGVHLERNAVVTDQFMRTNVSGVYAVGDVNGKSMLAHTAYREAEVAVNHLAGKKDQMRYNAISSVIYTSPEVACVGETEATAKAKGIDVKVAKLPMSYAGRYLAESENPAGICKLVMDTKNRNLIGVHIMGVYASEFIYGAAIMIETEIVVDDLKQFVIPHPTVGEIIHDTLYLL